MTRIFQPPYTDKGKKCVSRTYHVAFRDHLHRRQTLAGFPDRRKAESLAVRIESLVKCRAMSEPVGDDLSRWLQSMDPARRTRLASMELVTPEMASADKTMLLHLDGEFEAEGNLKEPGYKQPLQARGDTDRHVTKSVERVRKILEGCTLFTFRDLIAPGAVTRVEVLLGEWRKADAIGGTTLNYYICDFRAFCRWLKTTGRIPSEVMTSLKPVKNAEVETDARRPLEAAELLFLLPHTAGQSDRLGLSEEERARLYRFAFETGLRPGQFRALKVRDFNLDSDRPTVTGQARFVKRRKAHTQMLRPAMAAELRETFNAKMPDAPAFRMPSETALARVLRADLASARVAYIAGGKSPKERVQRQRDDFLAEKNSEGERAVCYSIRHGHGTALAAAGVPEKDIAASMHHASRVTTKRDLHTDRHAISAAIALLPDVSYEIKRPAQSTTLRKSCARGTTPVEFGGVGTLTKRQSSTKKRI